MSFFDRLANGWSLAWTSTKLVWNNKKLMVFPVISTICLVLVVGSFAAGLYGSGALDEIFNDDAAAPAVDAEEPAADAEGEEGSVASDVTYYLILFAFYFVCYFVIVFFNMALIHCANHAFNGSPFTLGTGLSFSFSRIGAIFSWALVSATVGVILRLIEDKNKKVAAIIAAVLGMVWSLLTFFVVPIIAYENVGPFTAIKRSSSLLKNTWGERISASFAFGGIGFVLALLVALPVGLLLWFVHPIACVVGVVLCLAVISTLMAAAETVFKAAVYQYAIGHPVDVFAAERIRDCFVAT